VRPPEGAGAESLSAVDDNTLPILERLRNLAPCADCFSFVTPRLSSPSGATIMRES
jgi:hypothetical protein